jgi:hypothetical protein
MEEHHATKYEPIGIGGSASSASFSTVVSTNAMSNQDLVKELASAKKELETVYKEIDANKILIGKFEKNEIAFWDMKNRYLEIHFTELADKNKQITDLDTENKRLTVDNTELQAEFEMSSAKQVKVETAVNLVMFADMAGYDLTRGKNTCPIEKRLVAPRESVTGFFLKRTISASGMVQEHTETHSCKCGSMFLEENTLALRKSITNNKPTKCPVCSDYVTSYSTTTAETHAMKFAWQRLRDTMQCRTLEELKQVFVCNEEEEVENREKQTRKRGDDFLDTLQNLLKKQRM